MKELGTDPSSGATIKLMKGRYGPYVTDGSTNATVRDGNDPNSITLEQAITLIAERAAKGAPKKKNGGKKKATKEKTTKEKPVTAATENAAAAKKSSTKKKPAKRKPEPATSE